MAMTSVQYIKEAAKKLMDSKLQKLETAKTQEILKGVMETVGLESMEEVYLFVAHFDLTCRDRVSNMDNLSNYFECSSLDMIEYVPALKSLERKGLLVRHRRREENIIKQNFAVSDSVMAAIIENKPVPKCDIAVEEMKIDKYEFCKRVGEKIEDDNVFTDDLIMFVENLEKNNCDMPFIKSMQNQVTDVLARTLFYDMCFDNMRRDGVGVSQLSSTLKDIYTNMAQRVLTRKDIAEGNHVLIKQGLIEAKDDDNETIYLSDTGMELFYGEDVLAFCKPCKCRDIYTYLNRIYDSFHDSDYDCDNIRSCRALKRTLRKMEDANGHLAVIPNIKRMVPDEYSRVLFYTIGRNMVLDNHTSLTNEVRALYPLEKRKRIINDFKDGNHSLQKHGWVEVEKVSSIFGEQTVLQLTDDGKQMLLGEDAVHYISKMNEKLLLSCDKIAEKQLFFSEELDNQLSLLRNSLDEKYYSGVRTRLEENNLPKGMCVLLYGEPGTGKTESVMQIAKATGRAIMHVDISETKTCWFGESEKLIKKVFTDYRRLCEKSTVKPILLFNEADAVFSKRQNVSKGNTQQTENAIQNIILEEMENLDGILIATTNLADNLDGAFERRFLFKIRFDKPTVEAKKNIWMSKLPDLSVDDAQTLASSYEFSGGQIDNIVRKALMQEVITGEKPTLDSLVAMCNEEKISNNNMKKVGFN